MDFVNKIYPLVPLVLVCFIVGVSSWRECDQNKRLSTSKLICYYGDLEKADECYCTHVILPANSDVKGIERVKERAKGVKVYVSVDEFNQGLINLIKTSKIDGLELNLKKLDSKNDILDVVSTIKTKIGSDLEVVLSVPTKADLVAKYFDFKALSKHVDLFVLQTAFLGASTNVTFHPSRLSGMWDMQNTDSVVDLVSGLGAPLSKLVVAAPVQAFQFTLQNPEYTAPGSPALELQSITRNELCKLMHANKNWTLERDEDQAGPYIFNKNQWIAFEDSKSMDIKAKYSRIRGLAGIALKDMAQDDGSDCGSTLLEAAYNGLSRQARAPRGAVLHSLEREIMDNSAKPLDSVQLSPYKISRIIDTEGKIHVTRQDSRTEFQCSRQGYFVHPRSCNRFYRCVKFNQLSDDYNVFEFDCPAGLAFDERVEVCVWPGSLPHGTPCSGSSEIAPVPRKRFECPSEPGYYADPENCRWFFACLDHGKSPLSAYEFRCPFGLVFDGDRLVCEWPWLVPKCAGAFEVGLDSEYYYGGNGQGEGYAEKGIHSSGFVLQNYDGLGTLNAIKLGGVSGRIEKPIATVYSNVGSGSLGLGYQNSGGYIEGGGLSYKAAQALQNAGLLKVNNGVGYQAVGQNGQAFYTASDGAAYAQQAVHATGSHVFGNTAYDREGSSGTNSIDNSAVLFQQAGHATESFTFGNNAYQLEGSSGSTGNINGYQATDVHLTQGNSATNGAVSFQSFSQLHGAGEHGFDAANGNTEGGAFGYKIQAGYEGSDQVSGYAGNKGYVNVGSTSAQGASGSYITTANELGGRANIQDASQITGQEGAVSSQSFSSGVAGNTKIIGGGFSAVGPFSEINKLNNGQVDLLSDVQAFVPVTSAPESVPVVTAVPVPGIKTVARFETVNGGVIANIPEYQYKVKSHEEAAGLLTNLSTSFANFVVTSPAADQENNEAAKASQEGFLNGVTVSTARPLVTVTSDQPETYASSTARSQPVTLTQPAVSSVTFQRYDNNGGYQYEKPSIVFEEKPQYVDVNSYSTPRPTVFVEQQPQIQVSSTPSSHTQQSYDYQEPSVSYEQNPEIISKFTIRKPVIQSSGGYYYDKPTIPFEEKPNRQKTAVEDYTYHRPAEVTQYYYQQPTIKKEPIGPLYQQPQLLSTYTYQPPLQRQPVSTYTYQNVAQLALPQKPVQSYNYQSIGGSSYQYLNSKDKEDVKSQGGYVYYQQKPHTNTYQGGYVYNKPAVKFEETPVTYSTPKPTIIVTQPAVVSSYFNQYSSKANASSETGQGNVGYAYPKPAIRFEETPVTYSAPKPTVLNIGGSKSEVEQENAGYAYHKPAIRFEEGSVTYSTHKPAVAVTVQPAEVNSYFTIGSSKASTATKTEQANVGYAYPKPFVHFQEAPVTYSTAKPAVVNSYFNIGSSKADKETEVQQDVGYSYPRPVIKFEEAPKPIAQPAVTHTYFNIDSSKANANTEVQHENIGYVYPQPAVLVQPAVVNSYFNTGSSKANEVQPETFGTFSTPKSQTHVATSYFNTASAGSSAQQANVHFEETPVTSKPAVVSSYFNIASSKDNSESAVQQYDLKPLVQLYSTPKPAATVTSYFNFDSNKANSGSVVEEQQRFGYSYPKPAVQFEHAPQVATYSTSKPVQPAVVTTSYFNIVSSTPKPAEQEVGYNYQQPEIKYQANPVVYSTPKPAVISNYNYVASTTPEAVVAVQENVGYAYPKPQVRFEEKPRGPNYSYAQSTTSLPKPAVITSYFHQQSSKDYGSSNFEEAVRQEVHEVPFIKKTAYETGQYEHNSRENYGYRQNYQQSGKVRLENYQFPEHEKVKQAVFGEKIYQQPQVTLNYVQSTPKPTFVATIKTVARKKLQPVTFATITQYDSRYSSTVAPELSLVSTSRPISSYSFSSPNDQYQYNDIVKSTTIEPLRTYLPVTSTVKVTSALPEITRTKVVEEYVAPEVTTYLPARARTKAPSNQYLPSRRVKVTSTTVAPEITTFSREYLPVKFSTTEPQVYTIKSRRPRPVTVIKQNDAHPLLSAKLGAQCTCVSNTLKLRKKQKVIIVDDDENDEDDDGYVVDDRSETNGVERYNFEAQRVVDVTPGPEVYLKSSTYEPQGYVKKRVRVRPVSRLPSHPVTEVSEIFYKQDTSPALIRDESTVSDKEIVKAVRTGLKLVKQAAKEGAQEGTQEALSKQFDRYGPGGVRSRSEVLQGTVNCQRAGLFRHPTECNKFYACRWDCTKKRFTLHVFNCPVHLTFDNNLGACNWPSQGPACVDNTLITSD